MTRSANDVPVGATRQHAHERYAHVHGLATESWRALGTGAQLVVTDAAALPAARAAVAAVLHDIDVAASRFRPDSELTRLNTAQGAWVPVSPLLAQALQVAVDAARWTDGLVDPTVGAALVDHGYDRTFAAVATDGPRLSVRVRPVPGWRGIELAADGRQARVPAGTVVDLGATAKGLAADMAAAAAAAAACGVLVNLGGDISVAGDAPYDGWPVTVTDVSDLALPFDPRDGQTVVIRTGALATSSIRARRWRRGGVELHHILDPRSAAPAATPWRTVSVTAATCTLANAASTAAVILGERAPEWLEERGLHARLVHRDGAVVHVGGWPRPHEAAS